MDFFCELEKLECFYDLEKMELFYDLENIFHFINYIYYKPMRKLGRGMKEYMENGVKEEEEGIPSIHQNISNYFLQKIMSALLGLAVPIFRRNPNALCNPFSF